MNSRIRSFRAPSANQSVSTTREGGERKPAPARRRFVRPRFNDSNRSFNHPDNRAAVVKTTETLSLPKVGDNIRIIPLGGVEEIGKNMTAIEIGDDIIVMDAGFQFRDEDTPGVDYILPNTKYLEERQEKIRAVLITHGHLDHIGGIPYIMNRIGNPPLYSRALTTVM